MALGLGIKFYLLFGSGIFLPEFLFLSLKAVT